MLPAPSRSAMAFATENPRVHDDQKSETARKKVSFGCDDDGAAVPRVFTPNDVDNKAFAFRDGELSLTFNPQDIGQVLEFWRASPASDWKRVLVWEDMLPPARDTLLASGKHTDEHVESVFETQYKCRVKLVGFVRTFAEVRNNAVLKGTGGRSDMFVIVHEKDVAAMDAALKLCAKQRATYCPRWFDHVDDVACYSADLVYALKMVDVRDYAAIKPCVLSRRFPGLPPHLYESSDSETENSDSDDDQ